MAPRSILAHFDGKYIRLDEPVPLEANAKLLVVVLHERQEERGDWIRASQAGLARAYGDSEPEYPLDLVKEPHPDYSPRSSSQTLLRQGDVVLAPLPQADGQIKNRPALLLREMPPFGDVLICGISTQIHQRVPDFDEIVGSTDPDFISSRLKEDSLIRLGFLALFSKNAIFGKIGEISKERHRRLLIALATHLLSPVS